MRFAEVKEERKARGTRSKARRQPAPPHTAKPNGPKTQGGNAKTADVLGAADN